MDVPNSRPVALITGGTTGIGLATARLFAKEFAVVVTGRNPDTLAEARRTLPDDVVVLAADARSMSDTERVAAELTQRFGRVDAVFLNAGIGSLMPLEAVDEAFYDEHFEVNVKGQVFLLQKVLPLLTPGSSVVFNVALGVFRAIPNWSVYSATKGALLSFMRALSVELASREIRVNAVTPGPIDTPALDRLGLDVDARNSLREAVPLGRLGSAEDVAQVVVFLTSSAAAFITGAEIAIDGGLRVA